MRVMPSCQRGRDIFIFLSFFFRQYEMQTKAKTFNERTRVKLTIKNDIFCVEWIEC